MNLAAFAPPKLERIPVRAFDLGLTLQSGQTFHWHQAGDGWLGLVGDVPLYVEQREDGLYAPPDRKKLVGSYFSLDRSFASLTRSVPPGDPYLKRALKYARGMRLVRQPEWECLASFILSSMKKVAHIRAMSLALRERWGEAVRWRGVTLHAFPSPTALEGVGEAELRSVGLGYRAPLLLAASQRACTVDVKALRALSDADLESALRAFPGVGPKIARCTMLFGFQRDAAFPVDTWILKILTQCYFPDRKLSVAEADTWATDYFGPYAGWAQQCLFHWAREGRGLEAAE